MKLVNNKEELVRILENEADNFDKSLDIEICWALCSGQAIGEIHSNLGEIMDIYYNALRVARDARNQLQKDAQAYLDGYL